MSISERARAKITEMPVGDRPISEEFRLVAKAWVEADGAARMYEETKTAVFSQMVLKQGDMPVNRAEHLVKASPEWMEHLTKMVEARSEANLRRVQMKYLEMKFSEIQSSEANGRRERDMSR